MAPGVDALPPAGTAVPVAESFARYAATLEPRRLRQIRLALRLFEWLPFPWRFSHSSLEARERFLSDMERSRLWLNRDLLLLMKVLAGTHYARDERVRDAVGYAERCGLAAGEDEPNPDRDTERLG